MKIRLASDILRSTALKLKTAKLGQSYDYSSTQINLPDNLSKSIMSWGKANIPEDVILDDGKDTNGYEDDIHITVLYGLTDESPYNAEEILRSIGPFVVRLGLVTAFRDADGHDVIKIDVESPELIRLHYLLEKLLDNENKYPTYQPHITIAYVKKNASDKYIGSDPFKGVSFIADSVCYSSKNGSRININLGES